MRRASLSAIPSPKFSILVPTNMFPTYQYCTDLPQEDPSATSHSINYDHCRSNVMALEYRTSPERTGLWRLECKSSSWSCFTLKVRVPDCEIYVSYSDIITLQCVCTYQTMVSPTIQLICHIFSVKVIDLSTMGLPTMSRSRALHSSHTMLIAILGIGAPGDTRRVDQDIVLQVPRYSAHFHPCLPLLVWTLFQDRQKW